MTHSPTTQIALNRSLAPRRWSPRFGYSLALVGSAAVWVAIAALALA